MDVFSAVDEKEYARALAWGCALISVFFMVTIEYCKLY